jgi:hypothetical protein
MAKHTTRLAGIDSLADSTSFRKEYAIPDSAVERSMFIRTRMKF